MKFNKFIGVLTALACSSTLLTSLGASAATYSPYDVNQDGVVNIFDSMEISLYLAGKTYIPDSTLKRLDVNKNQIIDDADAECIQAYIVGASYSGAFYSRKQGNKEIPFKQDASFTGDGASTFKITQKYIKYEYKKNKPLKANLDDYIEEYPLFPSTTTLSTQGAVSYGLVNPNDQRRLSTNSSENTGIVQFDGGGTGFIVGSHKIATAAHCVYTDDSTGEYFKNLTIYTCDSSGKRTSKILKPVEVHMPVAYRESTNRDSDVVHDYALITVSDDLSQYTQFSLSASYNITGTLFDNVPIYVTGQHYGNTNNQTLYTDEGKIYTTNSTDNSSVLRYAVDTDNGQSGSPVYTITKQNIGGKETYVYTALAVHSGKGAPNPNLSGRYLYNNGARMTKYLTQFYLDNTYVGW